jgi:flagellar biosynthesis GTPase FlhF
MSDRYGFEVSYTGGKGWVAVGQEPYTRTWTAGAGRDGITKKSERTTRTVYGRVEDVFGNVNGNSSQSEDPRGYPRDTGEYDDIIGSLGDDVAAANDKAEEYANKAVDDLNARDTEHNETIRQLNEDFAARMAELTDGFNERYGALETMLASQQDSMQQFQTMMQGQMQSAQNSYNQQMQMMQNMQKARVPEAEENAFSAQIGDQREDRTREQENNRLSELSILSGLGTQSSPTAGLSLA